MSEHPQADDLWLEDLPLDAPLDCGTFRLSEREIVAFAAQYDPQPFHLSAEAARESIFGGLIASSTQSLAISCGLVVRANAAVRFVCGAAWQDIKLHRPVRPDTDYAVGARWTSARPSASKPDRGIATIAIEVRDADGPVMTYGIAYFVWRRGGGVEGPTTGH
jgi:acyl dehydratase